MVSFSKLAELSSGNIGFAGGSAVDTMPGMSFSECANAFNDYLSEQAIADYEREEACDEQLFEAAVMAMQCGDSTILENAMTTINESDDSGSKATVWERIKDVFRKIKDFFTSLLAKFTSWIAMHTKDGKSFYDSYIKKFNESKNTVDVKVHDFKNLDTVLKGLSNIKNNFVNLVVPTARGIGFVSAEEAKSSLPDLNVERSTIRSKLYEKLGISTDEKLDKWLLGEESTKKCSVSDKSYIQQTLISSNSGITGIKDEYNSGIKAVSAEIAKCDSAAKEGGDTDIINYSKAYSKLFNAVVSEKNKILSACIKAYKKRVMEAKKMMRSVIVGKDVGDDTTEAAEGTTNSKSEQEPETAAAEGKEESVGFDGFDFDL